MDLRANMRLLTRRCARRTARVYDYVWCLTKDRKRKGGGSERTKIRANQNPPLESMPSICKFLYSAGNALVLNVHIDIGVARAVPVPVPPVPPAPPVPVVAAAPPVPVPVVAEAVTKAFVNAVAMSAADGAAGIAAATAVAMSAEVKVGAAPG